MRNDFGHCCATGGVGARSTCHNQGMANKAKPAEHLDLTFRSWVEYYEGTMNLVHLTYEGLSSMDFRVELGRVLGEADDSPKQLELKSKAAEAHKEIDADYPTLHAHSLLGLWGSLERLIEDIFIMSALHDPSIFDHEKLSKIRLPVRVILGADEDRAAAVLLEHARSTGADQKVGVGQFEALLKPLDLDGHVPRAVQDAVLLAQQIRHVWAHRGGIADARFVQHCGRRAEIGDTIQIGQQEFHHLAHGLQVYGLVVLNRHFGKLGKKYTTVTLPGFDGIWEEIGMINEEEAPAR